MMHFLKAELNFKWDSLQAIFKTNIFHENRMCQVMWLSGIMNVFQYKKKYDKEKKREREGERE